MREIGPLKLIVENYPADKTEEIEIENNPGKEGAGVHKATFGRELYIEESDFSLDPPPKYFRLKPGGMVRLKGAYIVEYTGSDVDENGNVTEVRCRYIEDSRSGGANAGIKVKGVIHWVNAADCVDITVNRYDYLINDVEGSLEDRVNPDSKTVLHGKAEKFVADGTKPFDRFQFMRQGYYMARSDYDPASPVFNEIVGLKDNYNK